MIEKAFTDTVTPYSNSATASKLWAQLAAAYSTPERNYHNLAHLGNMLQQLQEVKAAINNWDPVVLALAYHDAVYEALEKDNEAKSAQLATEHLQQAGLPEALLLQVSVLILATKEHRQLKDNDANLFTDADLSILGAAPAVYDAYAQAVRREYQLVPDLLYKPGRKKVLQHFLAMPHIFKTTHFQNKYEEAARINMSKELAHL